MKKYLKVANKDDKVLITAGEHKGKIATVTHPLKDKPYTRVKWEEPFTSYFGRDWSTTVISVKNKHLELITKETHPELFI